ncbi:MAG: hypothetical protein L6Q38_14290, partial [Nitrospira sp.]|nr:hypothetical protein [Nitrospira sp.]
MYLSQANLKCHVAASENGRWAFRSIALTDKGTVSTDGRLLLFVPYPKVEDVPPIKGMDLKPLKEGETLLLDPEDAVRAAGMVPN